MENKRNRYFKKKQVIKNRAFLGPIIETIILCGRRNIALRGNNDSDKIYDDSIETNASNFRSLLRFKLLNDSILDKHLKNVTSFKSYTSSTI